jgi:PhoPQ-activated pathogenicity-related protein
MANCHFFIRVIAAFVLFLSPGATASTLASPTCFDDRGQDFGEALACYRTEVQASPLVYQRLSDDSIDGVRKRRFRLWSQHWRPEHLVSPGAWSHEVTIYVPEDARHGDALLLVGNGTLHAGQGQPSRPATEWTDENVIRIAKATGTIVVSISDIPNQYLTWADGKARTEDDGVAHSWKLMLAQPAKRSFVSLHVPMMGAVVRVMDLAERELKTWDVHGFIVSGISKRGWAAWHTALVDTRVKAMVPFVIDVLDTDHLIRHTRRVYGGSWPVAFHPYWAEGVLASIDTPAFERLMRLEDPLRYLEGAMRERLAIPKYLVNASGDDFFVPDHARHYLHKLPGPTVFHTIPNSGHDVLAAAPGALIGFVNRIRSGKELPVLDVHAATAQKNTTLRVDFSEMPVALTHWIARNPRARDFRYACGVRYEAMTIPVTFPRIEVELPEPDEGWTASFVEARFADGLLASTPVYVTPEDAYPEAPPPGGSAACQTIAETGNRGHAI